MTATTRIVMCVIGLIVLFTEFLWVCDFSVIASVLSTLLIGFFLRFTWRD